MYGAARIRSELMKLTEYNPVEDALLKYLNSLESDFQKAASVST
jgi:hypothetical protein